MDIEAMTRDLNERMRISAIAEIVLDITERALNKNDASPRDIGTLGNLGCSISDYGHAEQSRSKALRRVHHHWDLLSARHRADVAQGCNIAGLGNVLASLLEMQPA